MPRNYMRKTEKAKWTSDDLSRAIDDLRNGVSQRKAAKNHNIPFATFQQRYKALEIGGPSMGRKPVFTKEQEAEICANVKALANMYYGLTPLQLRKLVFEYAERLQIAHTFNREKKLAGKDWLEGFLKRNLSLSVRKPEALSLNRIKGFSRDEVTLFFKNLEKVMVKHKFSPHRIYNMDESGFTTVQETSKIIGIKGQKRIGSVTSGERGKTTTVICCMNAAGGFVPPMFIYARKRMAPTLEVNGPSGALYSCSVNGWTNEDLFVVWLKHFYNYTKPTRDEPALLIIDNHGSHITLKAFTFCRENNIIMLSLPPHSSHRLQPLDVVFYGPLKRAYNRECDLHMKSKPGEHITVYKLAELFNKAYSLVATISKGTSGFASTGIFPMNPNIFSDEDFPFDATSKGLEPVTEIELLEDHSHATDQNQIRDQAPEPSVEQQSKSSCSVSFTDISPLPGPSQISKTSRRKQHSIILTETPEKLALEEKEEKRIQRQQRKNKFQMNASVKRSVYDQIRDEFVTSCNKKRKRNVSSSSESDVEENDLCQNSSDDQVTEGEEPNISEKKEISVEKDPQIQENDFVFVLVSNDKSTKRFVAQVTNLRKNEIVVRFMREYRGQHNIFVFPNVDDVSVVTKEDIIGKLSHPEKLRYGKIKFH